MPRDNTGKNKKFKHRREKVESENPTSEQWKKIEKYSKGHDIEEDEEEVN